MSNSTFCKLILNFNMYIFTFLQQHKNYALLLNKHKSSLIFLAFCNHCTLPFMEHFFTMNSLIKFFKLRKKSQSDQLIIILFFINLLKSMFIAHIMECKEINTLYKNILNITNTHRSSTIITGFQ